MPRKSTGSTAQPKSPTQTNGDISMVSHATEVKTTPKSNRQSTGRQDADSLGIDDLLLPRSLTSRLARGVLPANTQIQKDALLALTKSATVFISYLASHANELTAKKTISPQDVLNAIKEIEMSQVMGLGQIGKDGRMGGRLERELEMYEDAVKGKRKGYREKVKARESGGISIPSGGDDIDDVDGEDRGEPQSKKVRRMSGDEDGLLDKQLNGPHSVDREIQEDDMNSSSNIGQQKTKISQSKDVVDEGDDTEEDPELEDRDEDEEEEEEEDDEEGDDAEEEDDDDDHLDEEDRLETSDIEKNHHRREDGNRPSLAPNGRIELGSEDESD